MDCEIVKGKPLSKEESKFLLDLIEDSKIIMTTKTKNASYNKLKSDEWVRVTERFNATVTDFPRSPQQLRLKWENLKKTSRKRLSDIKANKIKNHGCPPDYIPPDEVLDRVASMLKKAPSEFTVPLDDDKETMESENDGSDAADETPIKPLVSRRFTLNTLGAVRKRLRPDESTTARNKAIAEYFTAKKKCIDAKLNNIYLENETLKLKNTEQNLINEKLFLETEKLKLELEKLRKQ